MVSQYVHQYEKELGKLVKARTYQVRNIMRRARGASPNITRKTIRDSITKMRNFVEAELITKKQAREILRTYDHKKQWHPKRGKGWGLAAKKREFRRWYDKHISTKNCVYVFWQKRKCLYVGRTMNGKGRPSSHFEKHWFSKATRIDIFEFQRKREVPRFECLMTHAHSPIYSKIKPAKKKYYIECPVCASSSEVSDEIRELFRLR